MRLQARNEALQERVTSLQHETITLRQQLDDARQAATKGEGAEYLQTVLTSIRADQEKVLLLFSSTVTCKCIYFIPPLVCAFP